MIQFLQAVVNGMSLAATYAVIALGFVIVYKSMQVVNFAQPALLLLGAWWVIYFSTIWKWGFWVALLVGGVIAAITGLVIERVTLRPMVGKPVFAVAIMTIGLNTVLTVVALNLLGNDIRAVGDPWGLSAFNIKGVVVAHSKVATLVAAVVLVAGLLTFFRFSRMGLAMRAAALDQEVALVQGVSVSAVFALAWVIAAVLAMVGGVFLATGIGFSGTSASAALKALPVVVLGGLDSITGALVGAIIIGLAESLTGAYQPSFLGPHFSQVVPYLIMFLILLIRPYGLFGTREVERV